MHTHIIPKDLPNFAERFGYGDFIFLQHHKPGFAKMMRRNQFFREIGENCWNPELRIKEYDKYNTQVQVICTIPVLFNYWARPDDGLITAQFLNDHIASVVAKYPKNYIGLGTVPMQDPDLAIQELKRCKNDLNLPGVQIGSNINDENLNEEKYFPFFEACQQLGMAVLVHPWNMMGQKNMPSYWLPWLVGMPAETARAICSFIFGGIFEKLPKLRVNFAHGGGSFLPTLGRIEHGFNCRPDLVAVDNPINPRAYLGKFWVDSITHDPILLEYILKMVGSSRITLGSDYPFPLGDLEIGKMIEDMGMGQDDLENIFSGATLDWLNLKKDSFVN